MPCAPGRSSIVLDRVGALDGPPHLTVVSRARPCSAGGGRGAPGEERMRFVRRWMALALVAVGCATGSTDRAGLDKLEHIVVIYAENRSFDNLYGLFPGANGIANATAGAERRSSTTTASRSATAAAGVEAGTSEPDSRVPARVPNRPFRIDAPPLNLPLDEAGAQPRPRVLPEQEQINGGRNNHFVAMSDAGALGDGLLRRLADALWQVGAANTRSPTTSSWAPSAARISTTCGWSARARRCDATRRRRARHSSTTAASSRRSPSSPASAMRRRRRSSCDGAVTPDGYCGQHLAAAVPAVSGVPPAAGGDLALADPARPHRCRRRRAKTIGDTLSAKGVSWAWYAGGWNAALADGMQPPTRQAQRDLHARQGTPDFQPHHQPFNYFARFAPGTPDRARAPQGRRGPVRRHRRRHAAAGRFYKPAGR